MRRFTVGVHMLLLRTINITLLFVSTIETLHRSIGTREICSNQSCTVSFESVPFNRSFLSKAIHYFERARVFRAENLVDIKQGRLGSE
jgi:hypothetical protein